MSTPSSEATGQAGKKSSKLAQWSKKLTFASSLKHIAKTFIRIFAYTSPKDRLNLLVSFIASVCAGATLPLINIIFAKLVQATTILAWTPPQERQKVYMKIVNEYVLYMIYLFVGRLVLSYVAILGFRITSLRISAAIRLTYLQCLFQQPISTLDVIPPGSTAAIITITANQLQLGISERLSTLIQAISVMLTALIIGCCYSWSLMLVTGSGLLVIVLYYMLSTPIVVKKWEKVQAKEREAAGVASDALSSIRMVAACGAENKMTESYNKVIDQAKAYGHKMSPIFALQHSPVFFTVFATFALCFWFAVKLYLGLKFRNLETLVVVLMSAMTMLSHIHAVSVPLTAASNSINAATIFFTIIDAPKPETGGIKDSEVDMNKDIILENVNFAYPTRHDVKVLEGLNLRFPVGKTTAIVGPSGSGKSTIVGLIQRWYQLDAENAIVEYLRNGIIKIGEQNIHEIDLKWWRSQIGLVQQEPFLFNDTIFKNVEYGLAGTEWEDASFDVKKELVEQACQEAYADEFITKLPQGYDTEVGDVGIKFSGGQRQRIAIARSIVRRPKILIFDEATSALDVTSERIVQAALEEVSQNRTTIVIAHRLSTIKKADNIVVLSKGKVVQQGTHESLLAEDGEAYWKLVNAQQLMSETEKLPIGNLVERNSEETLAELGIHIDFDNLLPVKEEMEFEFESVTASVVEQEHEPQKPKPRSFVRSFGMLLVEQKRNWIGYLVMMISATGAASSYALQAYLFARLISAFSFWGEWVQRATNFLCIMLVVVACGVGLSYFALGWTSNTVSVRTTTRYRKEYFRNIISKPVSFFDADDNSTGMLTARIATDPAQLQQLLGINMAMVVISILNVVGCMTISFYFGWKFSLVIIAGSMPVILASAWYRVRFEVKFEARSNGVFAESAKFATESIRAIRTVASLTLERSICRRYEALLKGHIKKSLKESWLSCIVLALSDSLVLLCMAFALWYGGTLLARGEVYPFNFLVIYMAVIQGSMAAGQWLSFGPNIAQVSAAANRIYDMRPKDSDTFTSVDRTLTNILPEEDEKPHKGAALELRNVLFQYPTRNTPVIRDLSLTIQAGQFAGIVGASGSGKTTIISLLERFYEPQKGRILYNGADITSIPLQTYRQRLSLVAQEPYLFRGTIRDNILLGVDPSTITDETLHQACREAGIHTFISSLPDGYSTDVGTSGVALSGGQKQRISIARALIRNPSVLLLDEATSSLDSETEKEVQEVFERTGKGRTMVVVAHRLATVQNADVIFVMLEGRVVERGSHGDLLRRRGWYWQMCQAQALNV